MKFRPNYRRRIKLQKSPPRRPADLRPVLPIGPNFAFLLLTAGLMLLYCEFIWVGKVVFAVTGAICALLGIAAFVQMPHALAGLLLLFLAAVCFAVEAGFKTFGLAGAVASILWAIGFWKLVPTRPAVSPWLAFPVSAIFGAVTTWLLSIARRARWNKRHN